MSIQDEIFRVTGLGVSDGQAAHFSKTTTESLQDAESRFLFAQVGVTVLGTIEDMWIELAGVAGANSVNDAKLAYWSGL